MLFGLKEYLIDRAGDIIEEQLSSNEINQKTNEANSIPFITETTGGRLNCRKILFVNWLLPIIFSNDDDLTDSIRFFIAKIIQYIIKESEKLNLKSVSIAFAVPDSAKEEDILAEEMIEETINQIHLAKSKPLKVSFVLLPEQKTLHQQFLNAIQIIQAVKESSSIFHCPTASKIFSHL